MNRRQSRITTTCLLTALLAYSASPAQAIPRPPVGGIAGANKLMQGISANPDDLAFSPLLLQMAKLIGRTGLSEGFFLQNDGGLSTEPSIDLRTLLLYQAGLLKMPIRIVTGRKGDDAASEPLPKLSVAPIPEPRRSMDDGVVADLPSVASQPLPREPELVQPVSPRANIGQPERISLGGRADAHAKPNQTPLLSLDVSRLKADLGANGKDEPEATQLIADVPQLAMAMPRTTSMPFITRNMFRLWTWRPEQQTSAQTEDYLSGSAGSYNGTFVVATTGAIKSITGRHFTMAPGRLLSNNQGGELLFETPLAEISVEPQATAVVELVSRTGAYTLKVYALESGEQNTVSVRLPGAPDKPLQLSAGEILIVGDHALSDADFAGTYIESRNKLNPRMARGKFLVGQYIAKELMLKSQAGNGGEQYNAITSLKKRISQPR
jgi:hypothetical protein